MIDTVHIAVCMKPIDGNFASNAVEHGVSGLNVDGCRVEAVGYSAGGMNNCVAFSGGDGTKQARCDGSKGRWPANVLHDGSDEVVELFPESKSTGGKTKSNLGGDRVYGSYAGDRLGQNAGGLGDDGSASRFFQECQADDD